MTKRTIIPAVLGAALLAAACSKPILKPSAAAPAPAPQTQVASDAQPDLRNRMMRSIPELKTVYFAYDSDTLTASALSTLKANAEYLKSHDGEYQVAGNCDQRGTVEYNLALGQRRADAVRKYYKALGVDVSKVGTISYGKERLVCEKANEACWKRNRRSETLVALPAGLSQAK